MGKRSFEEIGKPLPNRKTIVISNTTSYEYENCITLGSLAEAIAYVGEGDAFVAGGEQLYREALPLVDVMHLTMIDLEVEGDTYFPHFKEEEFELIRAESYEGETPYQYLTYVRRGKPDNNIDRSKQINRYNYLGKRDEVAIRYATPEDAGKLCIWWNDGKVMAHAGFPNGLNTTEEAILEQINNEDKNRRRIILEIGNQPVGEMSYHLLNKTADIGIKICELAYQEQGFGTKALKLLIEYLFTNEKVDKIVLDTNLDNTRAQHVYEKIGFTRVAVHIEAWKDQLGQLQSFVDYELLKENYYL
jgi:RimJ/RimL family protein N-acetyltransferase